MASWSACQQENIDPLYHPDVRVRAWARDTNGGRPQANLEEHIFMDLSGPAPPPSPEPDEQGEQVTPPQFISRYLFNGRLAPHPSTPRPRRGGDRASFTIFTDESPTHRLRQRAIQRATARAAARLNGGLMGTGTTARASSSLRHSSSPLPRASSSLPRSSSSLPNLAALSTSTTIRRSSRLTASSLLVSTETAETRDFRTRLQAFNEQRDQEMAAERQAEEEQAEAGQAQEGQAQEGQAQEGGPTEGEEVESVTGSVVGRLAGVQLMSDAASIASPITSVAGRLAGVQLRSDSPTPSPARFRMRNIQRDARGRFVRRHPNRSV